jgi:hypothetical protein
LSGERNSECQDKGDGVGCQGLDNEKFAQHGIDGQVGGRREDANGCKAPDLSNKRRRSGSALSSGR